ncbi:ScbR family autoregulator-binding transcription factor [Gryllotalpicola ginsengisoli]|uniref:ScbR family autoregulator-binding transcription factor n=1 Tax=Gryllotalpicola ginsengisoli TaxID=444608 RepID=UPI0003B3A141|nr:ScbR family autoregulator-binding transcription factor [Gryllotalpicola ginsengisoli]
MPQQRASSTRDEILRAAAAEFDEFGYAGASMSGIGARLGKTKGALSYHFSSKEALAREIIESQFDYWASVLRSIRSDGHDALAAMILLSFAVGRRFRDDVVARAAIGLQHDASLARGVAPTPFVGWNELSFELLAEAVELHHAQPTLSTDDSVEVLVEGFTGLQQVARRLTAAADIDERVRRYWLLALPGLGVPAPCDLVDRLAADTRY